jgi:tetratricopeptide (TPR) repeat protein
MKTSASILAALSLGLAVPFTALAKDTVRTSRGSITLPTYPWAAVKHPYFRGTDRVNIYPYPMLDFLSRDKTNRTYQTVVLENDYLRITFLPELGGKIHEVIDKTTGQEMFYVNHVIKPALIGQAGAWTSGGVEWNTGPQGHTVGCMQPVPVVILPREKDGSQSVAIGETERIYGTKWTVIVTLRPGRSFIEERIRIYNPTETIRPYYFWNCTAAPNTKGFRFIYPMTLGTDHGAEKFFHWPINEGKDLSRGTNYQDASSIFAWYCDQDFFGSYNDDLDRGVVAYANHHQLPGKKAWTWGWGSYGTMHQMDLTDNDGPYNEVQTGPLLTQGEVGRLDPCEAVEWQEWWYPIHGLGGFTFANKDVAVQAERNGTNLTLRLMGSGVWKGVSVTLWVSGSGRGRRDATCDLSPRGATVLRVGVQEFLAGLDWFYVELREGDRELALFPLPLDLPKREPPPKRPAPQTASELAQAGWEDFLFARFPDAESHFRKALEADPKSVPARTGLAFLRLDSDPKSAMDEAASALGTAPDSGLAHYARAVAADRAGDRVTALDEAWKAALDPATATAARALVAKLETRFDECQQILVTLCEAGPWQGDPLCRNRLAYACLQLGDRARAIRLARENLAVDPLDTFAQSILWMAKAEGRGPTLQQLLQDDLPALMELTAGYADIVGDDWPPVHRLLDQFYLRSSLPRDAIASYWAARGLEASDDPSGLAEAHETAHQLPAAGVFPHRAETARLLRDALGREPKDGKAVLYLGHLLFHLGRHAEGREMWKKAAELGAEPVIAYRALGMAAKTLDGDLKSAREWLEKANQADPEDAIVARDLANVLFALADKTDSAAEKRELTIEARDRLKGAFEQGKGRSDFVALLARSHSRLGESAETAKLLDSVRITIWEGAHEAHDLFEEAHLALGDAHLKAGRPAEALAEFNRALEYPKNLATGRLENTCDAHIHFQRGQALAALGRKDDAVSAWRQAVAEPASKDPKKEGAREQAREALLEAAK